MSNSRRRSDVIFTLFAGITRLNISKLRVKWHEHHKDSGSFVYAKQEKEMWFTVCRFRTWFFFFLFLFYTKKSRADVLMCLCVQCINVFRRFFHGRRYTLFQHACLISENLDLRVLLKLLFSKQCCDFCTGWIFLEFFFRLNMECNRFSLCPHLAYHVNDSMKRKRFSSGL